MSFAEVTDEFRTSDHLRIDAVYTRQDLRDQFQIIDATINNGVFRPKSTTSIWLFITEEKTADRTQYRDRLEGDVIYWQGQTSGRTDRLIIEHERDGLELLVFLRKHKLQFAGAGFRYLGAFRYLSHSGGRPTDFVLQRMPSAPPLIGPEQADDDEFDPDDIVDARERISRTIAQRRGQRAFRNALIDAYGGKCAISGCDVLDVLEAAHIAAYRGPTTNTVNNGLLLRADLHTLFDCDLIAVDPMYMTIVVSPSLSNSIYRDFDGLSLRLPRNAVHTPSRKALEQHHLQLRHS